MRIPTSMPHLIDIQMSRYLYDHVRIDAAAILDCGALSPTLKRQTLLNLSRGYCSSLGGQAYEMYFLLARLYKIPLFALGRTGYMILSTCTDTTKKEVVDRAEAMWRLGVSQDSSRWHYYTYALPSPAPGWNAWQMMRPMTLNVKGLCSILGVRSLTDIVPAENLAEATSAVLRSEKITIPLTQRS